MGWNKNTVVQQVVSNKWTNALPRIAYHLYFGNGLNDTGIPYVLCYSENPDGTRTVDIVKKHPDCDMDDSISTIVLPSEVSTVEAESYLLDSEYPEQAPAVVKAVRPLATQFVVKNIKRADKARFLHPTREKAQKEIERLCKQFKESPNNFVIKELTAEQIGDLTIAARFQGI